MTVRFKLAALGETSARDYLLRFALGGATTVAAGLIAARFGPVVGGLFLAFPAIFPASATLVERHVRQRKQRAGLDGAARGRNAAARDARGAMLGSFALAAFAAVVWLTVERWSGWALLPATTVWLVAAFTAWRLRRGLKRRALGPSNAKPVEESNCPNPRSFRESGG
jgi:MFS family permease